MSHGIPFDTLAFVKELEDAGIPPAHAEAQAKALATVMRQVEARVDDLAAKREKQTTEKFDTLADRNEQQMKGRLDGLATKQELDFRLATVEANLKRDIKELDGKIELNKAELRKDIETAKVETIKWVIATGLIILGGVATINRLFPPIPVYYQPHAQEMRIPATPTVPAAPTTR